MQNLLKKLAQQDTKINFEGGFGILCCVGGFAFCFCLIDTCISIFRNRSFFQIILLILLIAFNCFVSMINIYFRMKYSLSSALGLSFISGILISSSIGLTILFVSLTVISIIIKRVSNLLKTK